MKLLCTSLTSWTESAQLLKRSERWGKHRRTHTHTHKSISRCLAHNTHFHTHSGSHAHLSADQHTCTCTVCLIFMFLTVVRQRVGVIFVFLMLCECAYTCVWLCVLKTVSHRVKQRLVSDSPQHPPSTHTTQFDFSAVSTFHQRGFNFVPSI